MNTRYPIDAEIRTAGKGRFGVPECDFVALGIAVAAIIMFVGTGSAVLPQAVRSLLGTGPDPDWHLVNAFLLNIALIIFGWRRYRQLLEEVQLRRSAEEDARRLAETDPLTGCLNRRSFGPRADSLAAESAARGEVVALIMIDLDNFKLINDRNSHTVGDIVLQEAARRIMALLPAQALLARLGGDEFACLMPFDPTRSERIDQLAAAIADAIAHPIVVCGNPIDVTVSLGLTRSDSKRLGASSPLDLQTLLHTADIAMYQAKRQGRNRFFWFEAQMETESHFRLDLETGIREGIARGEFIPYYEQQIDLTTGRLTGFEMLARWDSPKLGMVSPDIFIPIAEEIGTIGELSESVIVQALQDAKHWDPGLTLAVNISPLQLRDPWFAQKLLKLIVEANFPPSRLEIEITESSLHENVGLVRTLITSLKNQGIRVSLDDFGTGYASLAQLRSLPFDRIKIDRSFVSSLIEDRGSASFVRAITALGEGLGLPITAEGIETQAVLEELQLYGQFKGQGYFYGYPVSASDVHEMLAAMDLLAPSAAGAPEPAATAPDTTAQRRAGNA